MVCFDGIIRRLSEEGLKLTPQRKLLLEILFHSQGHLSADEIFDEVKAAQPNVAFGTIYRNLSLLAEIGIVNQLNFKDGRSRFELCMGHHHHLICLDCGNAIDVPECPFTRLMHETASANNFQIKEHNFEVFGYCEGCSKSKQTGDTHITDKTEQGEKP
jgi:Fe2+ or Zn2+ uptake regulation protein